MVFNSTEYLDWEKTKRLEKLKRTAGSFNGSSFVTVYGFKGSEVQGSPNEIPPNPPLQRGEPKTSPFVKGD